MKIRWTQNSVRLRITPTELAEVSRGETVQEALTFPGAMRWQVCLQAANDTQIASDDRVITISLSPADRNKLGLPEVEGVYFQAEGGLRYFVEKDYPCVHPSAAEAQETVTETFNVPQDFEKRKLEAKPDGE